MISAPLVSKLILALVLALKSVQLFAMQVVTIGE
jgi:hypothetical protein